MFETFSAELKEAREALRLSQEHLASKIKIDLKFLQAMEKGDFSFLPDIYVKAFLREYAREVELDEIRTLKKFALLCEGKSAVEVEHHLTEEKSEDNEKPVRQRDQGFIPQGIKPNDFQEGAKPPQNKNQILLISGLVFIIAVILIYFLFIKPNSNQIITEKPLEEILEEKQTAKQRFLEQETDTPDIAASDSISISLKSLDSSWIKVITDNVTEREYYLRNKQSLEIKALESFQLTIGNAAGISLSLNNESISVSTKSGNVVRCIIDRNGIRYLTPDQGKRTNN